MREFYKLHIGKDYVTYSDGIDDVFVNANTIVHYNSNDKRTYILSREKGEHKLPFTNLHFKVVNSYIGWNANLKHLKNAPIVKKRFTETNELMLSSTVRGILSLYNDLELTDAYLILDNEFYECKFAYEGELVLMNQNNVVIPLTRVLNRKDNLIVIKTSLPMKFDKCLTITKDSKEFNFKIGQQELIRVYKYSELDKQTEHLEIKRINRDSKNIMVVEI